MVQLGLVSVDPSRDADPRDLGGAILEVMLGLMCAGLLMCIPLFTTLQLFSQRSQLRVLSQRLADVEAQLAMRSSPPLEPRHTEAPTSPTLAVPSVTPDAAPPVPAPDPPVQTQSEQGMAESPPSSAAIPDRHPPVLPSDTPVADSAPGQPQTAPDEPSVVDTAPIGSSVVTPERLAVLLGGGLGAMLLLMGALFGLKTIADRGFLGPEARVGIGVVSGLGLWLAGYINQSKAPKLAATLAGTGAAILLATTFASAALFEFISNVTGLMIVSIITAAAAVYATLTRARPVVYVALAGALAAPLMLSSGQNQAIPFFAYLFLLTSGMASVARQRAWWDLALLTALGIMAEHIGWTVSFYEHDQANIGWAAAMILASPFTAIALWSGAPSPGKDSLKRAAMLASLSVSLLAIPWLGPISAPAYDPATGEPLVGVASPSAWGPALGATLLALPLWAAARRANHLLWATGATLVAIAGILPMPFWLDDPTPAPEPLWLGVVGGFTLGSLILAGHPTGRRIAPLSIVSGLCMALLLLVSEQQTATSTAAIVLLTGATLVDAFVGRRSQSLPVTLIGSTTALVGAAFVAHKTGDATWAWPAGAITMVLMLVPLGTQRLIPTAAAWTTAAVAMVTTYPALHVAWVDRMAGSAVGALPLALAVVSGFATLTLVRHHRVPPQALTPGVWTVVTLGFLTATLPLQLDNAWLTIALALETLAVAWASHRLTHPVVWVTSFAIGMSVAARLLLNPWSLAYGDASGMLLLNWTLYTWGVPMICLAGAAVGLLRRPDAEESSPIAWAAGTLGLMSMFVGFGLVNTEVSHAFQAQGELTLLGDDWAAGTVRSLSWAAYGLTLLVGGLRRDVRLVRLVGFGFVLLGACKVFLIDLWSLSGFARVLSLLGLGGSLLVAAYLFERLVLRTSSSDEPG